MPEYDTPDGPVYDPFSPVNTPTQPQNPYDPYAPIQFPEYNDEWAGKSFGLSQEIFKYTQDQDKLRKENITDSMAEIKRLFDGRAGTYGQLKDESFNLNRSRLNDLQDEANRNLNFSLARAGNVGGSTEIDKNKEWPRRWVLGWDKQRSTLRDKAIS